MTQDTCISRRRFLARQLAAFSGVSCLGARRSSAESSADPEQTAVELINSSTQRAIDRGLAFLSAAQHADGAFGSGGYSRNVAVCGLAGMAFMAGGSTPG